MINQYCYICKRTTGFRRSIGFGTFLAAVVTSGFWIFAVPFYPKRCITCGGEIGEKPVRPIGGVPYPPPNASMVDRIKHELFFK